MKKISDKKLQEKIGWSPFEPKVHQPQIDILKSKAPIIVIAAGKGFGKSVLCAYIALKTLLVDDKQICLIAPTYDLTQRVLEWVGKWLQKAFPSITVTYRPFPLINTPWGSSLECKSAENPTGIMGKRYDLVIVDEAAKIPRRVYQINIFPLTQITGGRMFFISTPLSRNWFYQLWLDVKSSNGAFQFRSIDNPYFPKENWDLAKLKLPEVIFNQQYKASFETESTSLFRGVRNIIREDCLEDVKEHHYYVMGLDLAKYKDFTVLTVLDKYSHKNVYRDRFQKIPYPLQSQRIIAVAKRYNNARIIIDSTGLGDPISDDLKHQGLIVDDFRISGKSKQQLIDKLSMNIEQKEVFIPPDEILIDELESYALDITEKGNLIYSAPAGLHDDCVISLALAVWSLVGKANPQMPLQAELEKSRKKTKFQYS